MQSTWPSSVLVIFYSNRERWVENDEAFIQITVLLESSWILTPVLWPPLYPLKFPNGSCDWQPSEEGTWILLPNHFADSFTILHSWATAAPQTKYTAKLPSYPNSTNCARGSIRVPKDSCICHRMSQLFPIHEPSWHHIDRANRWPKVGNTSCGMSERNITKDPPSWGRGELMILADPGDQQKQLVLNIVLT